jgi:hypothetical protein
MPLIVCKACLHWRPDPATKPRPTKTNPSPEEVVMGGECRKLCPSPSSMGNGNVKWPKTLPDDFCGGGEPR